MYLARAASECAGSASDLAFATYCKEEHKWPQLRVPKRLVSKPFTEFDAANEAWPRGERPAAIREAAAEFRARFATAENRVETVRTVDIAEAGYPVQFAFGGAARVSNPVSKLMASRAGMLGAFINILNRLIVVRYEDFEGQKRTFVYEPTVTEGPAEAPFYEYLLGRYGEFLSYKVLAKIYNTVPSALASVGVKPEEVDFISFDHLHVQDVRFVLGTSEPVEHPPGNGKPGGRVESLPPLFPNAKLITQRKELDTLRSLHPMQWAWYVKDGIKGVPEENIILIDGDVELGKGIALVSTPGHTAATIRCASTRLTESGSLRRTVSARTTGIRIYPRFQAFASSRRCSGEKWCSTPTRSRIRSISTTQ